VSIQKGNIAELEFLLQATRRNLIVSRPSIQQTTYDFLVDNNKRIFKVQVKSNFQIGPNHDLGLAKGSKSKQFYCSNEVDIIACFINKLGAWYILPINITGERLKIKIRPDSIDSKWNKYREGWGLFNP